MGNCFGSPIKVGDFTTPPPPSNDWTEIYDNLKTILCESYDWAAGLKHNFVSTNFYHISYYLKTDRFKYISMTLHFYEVIGIDL